MSESQGSAAVARRLSELIAADPTRVLGLPTAAARWEVFACLRGIGDLPGAAATLDAIAEMSGPLAKVLDAQAQLWPLLGRADEAIAAARERLERFPSASGEVALARTLIATEQLEEASAIAERLYGREPQNPTYIQLLARIALEAGDGEGAIERYEELHAANPEGGEAQLGPARARVAMGEEDEAARTLHGFASRADSVTQPAALTAWAELAEELGDEETAGRLRDRAIALWGDRAAAVIPDLEATSVARENDPDAAPLEAIGDPDLAVADEAPVAVDQAVLDAARDLFGYERLRAGQSRVIAQTMAGIDTLATMPTGAGKSLCYQLPAMLLPGVTLVISPLIALMQDQVASLPPAVAARTTLINSSIGAAENRRRQEGIARGEYSLVYAAPERLRQAPFLRALATAGVARLVIDEAHCISLWGHDFRPDYLIVPKVLPALGEPPVLALTATATPAMAREIAGRLGRQLDHVRVSLFRDNLFYEVRRLDNREAKLRETVAIAREQDGCGIVYVSSRDGCEQVAKLLNSELKRDRRDPDVALAYHAGFGSGDRTDRMRRFMAGEVRIMVATVAFGMGVDKSDVRFIVHLSPPNSLEAYAQESGRAGRDGQPARCVLLYANSDNATLRKRAKSDEFDIETLRRAYAQLRRVLGRGWGVVSPETIALEPPAGGEGQDQDMRVALGILERAGLIERQPDAPRELEVTLRRAAPPDDPRWDPFIAAADPYPGETTAIDTVAVGAALDLSPAELEGLLLGWAEETGALDVRAGRRDLCLRLVLPAPPDAAAGLPRLLDEVRRENEKRVTRMMQYASGSTCRHMVLAAHLGERLDPCGTVCDICTGTQQAAKSRQAAVGGRQNGSAPAPPAPASEAEAAAIVLDGLRRMPFNIGKSGLTKVLAGSITASVKEDRNPRFGALGGLSQGRIDALIERLIADDYIVRADNEYRTLSLTTRGAAADGAALAGYAAPQAAPARSGAAMAKLTTGTARALGDEGAGAELTLDGQQAALLERLRAWRSAEARERAVPPYIIAKDAMLHEVVLRQPGSLDELAAIKGFGPAKLDSFGAALLAIVAEA
jgi:ATP-dependent DNA helicase RecQ